VDAFAQSLPVRGLPRGALQPPDPFRVLKPNELVPLKPVSISPVGFYAYKIVWSDGHDRGCSRWSICASCASAHSVQETEIEFV